MCTSPIWIRNRRYCDKDGISHLCKSDLYKSNLALSPWDISRQWIMVPCGKCEECLKKARNDWYVRLERELAYCKHHHLQSQFVTITIAPKYYEMAFNNPSAFIRMFNERIRHHLGRSVKHAFFQEFGSHPSTGNLPRLHFHGFLFRCSHRYNVIRKCIGDLGFLWLAPATHKRARYVVKYVVKELDIYTPSGERIVGCTDKRFRRKFISPQVGNYLGIQPRPSFRVRTWDYMDFKTGRVFKYTIPRYYDRYLSEADQVRRKIISSYSYAILGGDPMVKCFLTELVERTIGKSAIDYRKTYSWITDTVSRFIRGDKYRSDRCGVCHTMLDSNILQFWSDNMGTLLSIT